MYRLLKLALVALVLYAIATASPAQQAAVYEGVMAARDAVLQACTREGSPCTGALASAHTLLVSHGYLSPEESASKGAPQQPSRPWLDRQPVPKP